MSGIGGPTPPLKDFVRSAGRFTHSGGTAVGRSTRKGPPSLG